MNFLRRHASTIIIIIAVSAVVIFFNSFPIWLAYTHAPQEMSFTGQASWFDPWDINVYVSVIRWGQHHSILIENAYTSEPNQAVLQYPLYALAGKLFREINPFLLFHLLATFCSIILISTLVLIVRRLLSNNKEVLIAVLIMCIGGGLGFMIHLGQDSMDASVTSVTLHSAFQRAHEGIALAAFFLALFGFYFWLQQRQTRWQLITQIALIIAVIQYPQNIASFTLITAAYIWTQQRKVHWKNPEWRFWFATILIGVLTAAAMTLNLQNNDSFSGVIMMSLSHPSVSSFIFGYGLLLLLFLYHTFFVRPKTEMQRFLTIWILSCVALSVLPLGFSRFFLRGLYVPLTLLAVYTIQYLSQRYFSQQQTVARNFLLINTLLITSLTSIQILVERIEAISQTNPWYYMTAAERSTLDFIRDKLPADATVLSKYYMGNQIPAHTDSRVFFGHLLQTPNAMGRQEQIAEFYGGKLNDGQALEFLQTNNIQYVYYGREEEGSVLVYPFLNLVIENGETKMYQLKI